METELESLRAQVKAQAEIIDALKMVAGTSSKMVMIMMEAADEVAGLAKEMQPVVKAAAAKIDEAMK